MNYKYLVLLLFICVKYTQGGGTDDNAVFNESITNEDDLKKGTKCKCNCGERNEGSRIVGGVEASISEFPWIARLTYYKKFYCGGMLINDRYILTAAHCVKGLNWYMIKVTLGEHNRCNVTKRPLTRFVTRIISNDFSFNNFRNDIAILVLNDVVPISDYIKPICLPTDDGDQYVGVNATAAGWGSIDENKNGTCTLQEVTVPVMSNKNCKKTKYSDDMIADSMMCAGYPQTGKKDACQGDSGGPLAAERKKDKRYELLGIVSWGIGCGRIGYPGVYTRVSKYLKWIKENTPNGCYCAS